MLSIGAISFLNPFVLLGILALPILWIILKVIPPTPKTIILPTTQFLMGLENENQTSNATPPWLLWLRVLTLLCVILAVAKPILNANSDISTTKTTLIIIDNAWASGQNWSAQTDQALKIINQAERENHNLKIITSIPQITQTKWETPNLLTPSQAQTKIKNIKPHPFKANLYALGDFIKTLNIQKPTDSFILSHGLNENDLNALGNILKSYGDVSYYGPADNALPLILKRTDSQEPLTLHTPKGYKNAATMIVYAKSQNGTVLGQTEIDTSKVQSDTPVNFDIPATLTPQISQYQIAGQTHAGGLYILNGSSGNKSVCIASGGGEQSRTPFIDSEYYLTRAVRPFTELTTNTLAACINDLPNVMIIPGETTVPEILEQDIANWINKGGILIRFAGPDVTYNNSFLPVPMRFGGARSLDGVLTWETPAKIKNFNDESPLGGITAPPDLNIKTQILAEPSAATDEKIWARLEDGTPLITGAKQGNGLSVFIHTTASPAWSNLALSGTYVAILKRLINLAGYTRNLDIKTQAATLNPYRVLDGFGTLVKPDNTATPIKTENFDQITPNKSHPPGLYGTGPFTHVLNLGDHVDALQKMPTFQSMKHHVFEDTPQTNITAFLIILATILFCADCLIMALIFGSKPLLKSNLFKSKTTALLMLSLALLTINPQAHANDKTYADGFYLAYVKTNSAAQNLVSKRGLQELAKILNARTSVDTKGVTEVDLKQDTLSFFPVIYWPLTGNDKPLSDQERIAIQNYMNNGGIILIDTKDGRSNAMSATSSTALNLQSVLKGLSIPPLSPIEKTHVLGKSFYLLKEFSGKYSGGTLWLSQNNDSLSDGISPIIIGANDWASEWANTGSRARKREMALRFGVNVVMMALVGNYKNDQVHITNILKRMESIQ